MAKVDKVENTDSVAEKKVEKKSDKKSKKSSYSKNPNFKVIDGAANIEQITSKIDEVLMV